MQITAAIEYIHPNLQWGVDYRVLNDSQWGWDYIEWYNTTIPEPTQAELNTAWTAKSKEDGLKDKMKRLYVIDAALRKMNAPWVVIRSASLVAINAAKALALQTEADAIQDDIEANYASTLVDDLYTSLFM